MIDTLDKNNEYNILLKQIKAFLQREKQNNLGKLNEKAFSKAIENADFALTFSTLLSDQNFQESFQFLKDWLENYNINLSGDARIAQIHNIMLYLSILADDIKKASVTNRHPDIQNQINDINAQKYQLTSTYQNSIQQLQDLIKQNKADYQKLKEQYENACKNIESLLNQSITTTFDFQNKLLSQKFDKTKETLKIERFIYLISGTILTFILGSTYIYFFIQQFTANNSINYYNHLMLIAVCTPFICLAIWLFFQVGRTNRLIDIYTHKANLAFTINSAIDDIKKLDPSVNKETTLNTLQLLLNKLYEYPEKSTQPIQKNLAQITALLKEIKDIYPSSK